MAAEETEARPGFMVEEAFTEEAEDEVGDEEEVAFGVEAEEEAGGAITTAIITSDATIETETATTISRIPMPA